MTKPTQAQIEAVIKAIADIDHYDGEGHGLCMTGYEEIARAVLTAIEENHMIVPHGSIVYDPPAATIERCAKVAECTTYMSGAQIAAAIRKLKEPVLDPNIVYPGKDPEFAFPEEEK